MPQLYNHDGETLNITESQAARLCDAGLIQAHADGTYRLCLNVDWDTVVALAKTMGKD